MSACEVATELAAATQQLTILIWTLVMKMATYLDTGDEDGDIFGQW